MVVTRVFGTFGLFIALRSDSNESIVHLGDSW